MINLKEILKEKNMSQKTLASLSGLTEAAISKYVSGSRKMSIESAKKVANALGMTIDELIMFKPMNADKIMAQYGFKMTGYDEKQKTVCYYNDSNQKSIFLDNVTKSIQILSKNASDEDWVLGIPFGMLKAIQMKLKELGWIDE